MPFVLIAGFTALTVGTLAWASVQSWDNTVGPFLEQIAQWFADHPLRIPHIHTFSLNFVARAIRAFSGWCRYYLSLWAAGAIAPVAHTIRGLARLFGRPAAELRALAVDVGDTLWHLRRYVIPAMIAAKVAWIPRHIAALESEVSALIRRAPVHIVHQIVRATKVETTRIVNRAVAVPWPRIGKVEREVAAEGKRLGKLERILTVTGLTSAVVAIALRNFPILRCRNFKKAAPEICKVPANHWDRLLADFLLATTALFALYDLVDFARLLQRGFTATAGPVVHFWRADVAGPAINPGLGVTGYHSTFDLVPPVASVNPGLGATGV